MPTLETSGLTTAAESVRDYVEEIEAEHTLFLTLIGTGGARAMKEEWPERAYEPGEDNAAMESEDAGDGTPNQPTMMKNFIQTLSNTAKVSTASSAVKTYGIERAFVDEVEQKLRKGRRDEEFAMIGQITEFGVDDNATGSTAGIENGANAARMASFHALLDSSVRDAGGGAFSETAVQRMLGAIFQGTKTVTNRILMVQPAHQIIADSWLGRIESDGTTGTAAPRVHATSGRELDVSVQAYMTSFGRLTLVPSAHILNTTALIFDPNMTESSELEPIDVYELDAGTGKAQKAEIFSRCTVKVWNSFSGGSLEGLTP